MMQMFLYIGMALCGTIAGYSLSEMMEGDDLNG